MYTVKFVDNETFDNLPYNKVATSIGVADRNSGMAYVRDTGNPMDVFTAYHELEHLKGDDLGEYESPGEDGIYYKGFGDILSNILPTIGGFFTGGPIGAGIGAAGSFLGGKGKEQQPQQAPMNQFNPQASVSQAQGQQAPAVSAVGGAGAGGAGGAMGQGTVGKMRSDMELAQSAMRQKGFYSGRDAGGM